MTDSDHVNDDSMVKLKPNQDWNSGLDQGYLLYFLRLGQSQGYTVRTLIYFSHVEKPNKVRIKIVVWVKVNSKTTDFKRNPSGKT